MVLCLRETHALILRVAKLVWEDNHKVLAREMFLQFIWQAFQSVFIRDGSLTGRHHHEQMVF